MNPRLGVAFLLAGTIAAAAVGGCSKGTSSVAPAPSPTASSSPAPDTLYLQDATTRTVRGYRNASALRGPAAPFLTLPTADTTNPDVVYSPLFDTLWYPVAYAPLTFMGDRSTPIDVWTAASTKDGRNPDAAVPFSNSAGAAAYDQTHDLLFVAQVNTNAVQIFASAHTLGSGGNTAPAGSITLIMTDPGIGSSGPPRAQEMFYDAVRDRLFVSDNGTIVAVFDAFGSTANSAAISRTNVPLTASRQISGLFLSYGLAYNPTADILFVVEASQKQIDVIHAASSLNGPAGHTQTITGFNTPSGLAYDAVRDILFVYDPINVVVLPTATTAAGTFAAVPNERSFFDVAAAISGFGIAVDTTR